MVFPLLLPEQIGFPALANLLVFLFCFSQAYSQPLVLNLNAFAMVYSGQEKMHFSISWSGGIKIGDLYLSIARKNTNSPLSINARVTDYGVFKFFYPVDDSFTTSLQGPLQLPSRYEVNQLEGEMKVHRLTSYAQQRGEVVYQKNNQPAQTYTIAGPVYNEFSSFFITRALQLIPNQEQIVPVFADKKRHKVVVKVFGVEPKETLFGTVSTIKVLPKMHFKGLYDKDGDTIFWLTNDTCRIPVEISSKILIGSLVAELVEYAHPNCPLRPKKAP
ncbi:MAG: DUF3108 domain-containing protein [Candidatus Electrothrix sp. AR3]|nr:DUF3108 domain-containing protein [Candidatus Electrothrix sp. AR3]